MYTEKFQMLLHKAPQESEEVEECINKIVEYVNAVMMHQVQQERMRVNCLSERISQEDFIAQTERLNAMRNRTHDYACIACHNLNILADRARMEPIFDFELEMEERNGVRICSQNNHHVVSAFAAQVVNELYEDGIREYQPHLIDEIAYGKTQEYPKQDLEILKDKAEQWVAQLEKSNMKEALSRGQTKFKLRDGVTLEVVSSYRIGDISVDAKIHGSTTIENMAGKNAFFFEKDGRAYDIPVSVLQEIAIDHGGFSKQQIRELEDMEH